MTGIVRGNVIKWRLRVSWAASVIHLSRVVSSQFSNAIQFGFWFNKRKTSAKCLTSSTLHRGNLAFCPGEALLLRKLAKVSSNFQFTRMHFSNSITMGEIRFSSKGKVTTFSTSSDSHSPDFLMCLTFHCLYPLLSCFLEIFFGRKVLLRFLFHENCFSRHHFRFTLSSFCSVVRWKAI